MGLEQEIKQNRPFGNQKEKAIVNILFTYSWLNDKLKLRFKPFGITPKQYNILRILNGADEPLTTSEIRNRMLDKMSDITRLIERLIKKKFVSKKTRSADKRLVDIIITEQGRSVLNQMHRSSEPLGSLFINLSEDEARILNVTLDKLRED